VADSLKWRPTGDSYDCYRSFIFVAGELRGRHLVSEIIIFGELAIAVALILGAFTGWQLSSVD
jgi:hypothetical protein